MYYYFNFIIFLDNYILYIHIFRKKKLKNNLRILYFGKNKCNYKYIYSLKKEEN